MIDTHAHFNSHDLVDLKEEIIRVNQDPELTGIINVGLDLETSREVILLSETYKKFYATIGIHPLHDGSIDEIKALYDQYSKNDKIVAIGEVGLDRGKNSEMDLTLQKKRLVEAIELANQLKLPVVIHANRTNREVLAILKQHFPQFGFLFHCFEPNLEVLEEIIRLGGYISVGTPITRPTAKRSLEVIAKVPIERLLIELDYPYMSQDPSKDGRAVFRRIQEIRNLSYQDLSEQLDYNACRMFPRLQLKKRSNLPH